MKVGLSSITEEGLIQEQDIKASLWEISSPEVEFVDNIHLWCEFKKLGDEILVKTVASTHKNIRCSRCLEVFHKDEACEFFLSYNRKELGPFLEIDKKAREELLLGWPMKPLCRQDCRGICSTCGKNLNQESCSCQEKINPQKGDRKGA